MINIRRRRDPLSSAVPAVPRLTAIHGPLRFVLGPMNFKVYDVDGTDISRLFPVEDIQITMESADQLPRVRLTLIGVDLQVEATIPEAQVAGG